MGDGSRNVPPAAWTALGAIFFVASEVGAADLPGAELSVSRTPQAAACADEETLARDLRPRMAAATDREAGPLLLAVELASEQDEFVATVRVSGRKQGVRTLRSKDPTCRGLHEALMVSLLLLLDEDPSRQEPAPPPAPASPPPPSVVSPPPAASPAEPGSRPTSLWISAGGALTHGFPERWSGATFADYALRWGALDLSIGGAFAPGRSHSLGGEREVVAGVAGARARACYAFFESTSGVRAGGCAVGVIADLRAEGRGPAGEVTGEIAHRAWWLGGAGPDAYLPLSSRIGVGIFAAVLIQDKKESFFIRGADADTYATDPVVGWVGADLRVRIW